MFMLYPGPSHPLAWISRFTMALLIVDNMPYKSCPRNSHMHLTAAKTNLFISKLTHTVSISLPRKIFFSGLIWIKHLVALLWTHDHRT